MQTGSINSANLETQAADSSSWRTAIRTCIRASERRRREQWEEKKQHKKQMAETTAERGAKTFKYSCGSRIGLYSHSRRCSNPDWHNMGAQPIVFRDRRKLRKCCSMFFFTEVNFKIKLQLYGFIRHLVIKRTLSVWDLLLLNNIIMFS